MFYSYILLAFIPVLIFTIIAQIRVHSTFKKYSKQGSQRHITGAQAAERILNDQGIYDVQINCISGTLTDHYNPRDNSLNLSEEVYNSTSVAAIGVACHEAGHAMQYAQSYAPVKARMAILPITRLGSSIAGLMIVAGLWLSYVGSQFVIMADIGLALFSFSVLFQLITLPVEINASRRAMTAIYSGGILEMQEAKGARKVLTAAAMTYVAALAIALLQFLRLLLIVRGNHRR